MSVYSATIPLLANTIGSDISLIGANFAFLAEAIAQEHGWDADDATAMVHSGLQKALTTGLLSERPDTGETNELYYATDNKTIFYGTGTGWAEITVSEGGTYADASTTLKGIVELATNTEASAFTDSEKVIVPSSLKYALENGSFELPATSSASTSERGIVELATNAEAGTLTDAERAVVPSSLKYALENGSFSLPVANIPTITTSKLPTSGTWTLSGGLLVLDTNGINFADLPLNRPHIKDYSEVVVSKGNLGATPAFDVSAGNIQIGTLSENITSSTFTNPSASGRGCSLTLIITQDSSARTVSWPASVDWGTPGEPDLTTVSKIYIITFITIDGGTTWYGFLSGNGFSI